LICNLLIKPVDQKHFMTDAELAEEKRLAHDKAVSMEVGSGSGVASTTPVWVVYAAWTAVGIPLAWGIYRTLIVVGRFF
jgi:hypothetical protein